jgi:hypothetical protein
MAKFKVQSWRQWGKRQNRIAKIWTHIHPNMKQETASQPQCSAPKMQTGKCKGGGSESDLIITQTTYSVTN